MKKPKFAYLDVRRDPLNQGCKIYSNTGDRTVWLTFTVALRKGDTRVLDTNGADPRITTREPVVRSPGTRRSRARPGRGLPSKTRW